MTVSLFGNPPHQQRVTVHCYLQHDQLSQTADDPVKISPHQEVLAASETIFIVWLDEVPNRHEKFLEKIMIRFPQRKVASPDSRVRVSLRLNRPAEA
jgi:hypothetical protein